MKLSPRVAPSVKLKTIFVYTATSIALFGVIVWLVFLFLNIGKPENAYAAQNYSSNRTGIWVAASSWDGSSAPTATNFRDNAIINSSHTITQNGPLSLGNGASTTINSNGKLVINGNLTAGNNITLIVKGELIVNGNITTGNGAEITVNSGGKITATGNMGFGNGTDFRVDGIVNGGNNITFGNSNTITFTGNGQVNTVGSGCSNWEGTGQCNQYQPLPVELVSFILENEENAVRIAWQTAAEVNNDYFTIEQSVDGINYQAIGTVKGSGTVNKPSYYEYVDTKPADGRSYYRLTQTDYDGKSETFKPASIDMVLAKSVGFKVYPNPLRGSTLNVSFTNAEEGVIEILNQRGHRVQTESVDGFSKDLQITLHGNLEPGLYYINYKTSSTFTTTKILKQ